MTDVKCFLHKYMYGEEQNYMTMNPANSDNNYFESYDLGLCATLASLGHELFCLDKTSPGRVKFIFKRTENMDELVNEYWSGKLQVSARVMFDNIKMLKNRIYSD